MEKSKQTQAESKAQAQVMGLLDEAMRTYEQNFRTGLKMQEEASRFWTNMFNQATSPQDWQRKVTRMADDWLPTTQKSFEESIKLIEQTNQSGMDLLMKAVEATQTTSLTESQSRWLDFWEASMKTMRTNAQTITQINGRAIDSWIDFVRKTSETMEPRTAAKA